MRLKILAIALNCSLFNKDVVICVYVLEFGKCSTFSEGLNRVYRKIHAPLTRAKFLLAVSVMASTVQLNRCGLNLIAKSTFEHLRLLSSGTTA